MKKWRIGIIDLIHNSPSHSLYRRFMFQNYVSIMPQVIGVWCKEEGHEVHYSIFTGTKKIKNLLLDETDIVFISSFSYTAQLAYALSNYFRSRKIVTVLGGPHARSFPEHACLYFDYVVGLTNKVMLRDLLKNFRINQPYGIYLDAPSQPLSIPGIRERWEFIEQVHRSPSVFKGVPMIGSFGCPYQCDFCVDADIPYQVLDLDVIKEDLKFLIKKVKHPVVGWFDPNFGIKFNTFLENIESAAPPGSIKFIAECSLSTLSESNVKILKRNGFVMIMLGIESWFDYGKKAKMEFSSGIDKVKRVADQLNMVQQYIPQLHANMIFGFDNESGAEPFELTKRFIDLAPGIYPAFSLLTVFGQSAEGYLKYDIEDRIVPFPFHMMAGLYNLNLIPKNYSWEEFYSHFIDLLKFSFSSRVMYRRFKANPMKAARWITLFLSLSVGGAGKISHAVAMLENLRRNPDLKSFMNKETTEVPAFMIEKVRKDLGPMWDWLPDKTLSNSANLLPDPAPQITTVQY